MPGMMAIHQILVAKRAISAAKAGFSAVVCHFNMIEIAFLHGDCGHIVTAVRRSPLGIVAISAVVMGIPAMVCRIKVFGTAFIHGDYTLIVNTGSRILLEKGPSQRSLWVSLLWSSASGHSRPP